MRRLPVRLTLVMAVLMLTPGRESAAQRFGSGRVFGGVGLDLDNRRTDGAATPGHYAVAGLAWKRADERFGFRVYSSVLHRDAERVRRVYGCGVACRGGERSIATGVEADVQIDLLRGSIRPYLLTGGFVQYSVTRSSTNYSCTDYDGVGPRVEPNCTVGSRQWSAPDETAAVGLQAGLGVAVLLGRAMLFFETRFRQIDIGSGYSRNDEALAPVIFGIRF